MLIVIVVLILLLTVAIVGWVIIEKKQELKSQEMVQANNFAQQRELQNKIEQRKQELVVEKKQQDVGKSDNVEFEAGTKNLKEGVKFDSGFDIKVKNECASGLVPVIAAEEFNGQCALPMCSCYVCTKCGDGICGKGENSCNCASDCKKGEGKKATQKDLYDPQFYSNNK